MRRIKKFNEGWKSEPESEEYYIVRDHISKLRDGQELTQEEKEDIDKYFEYPNLYNKLETWLQKKFDIISKYDMLDIEDRLIEFFDQVPKWDPHVMFSLYMKYEGGQGWLGITSDRIGDREYFLYEMSHIISDLLFHKPKPSRPYSKGVTVDEYLNNKKACISIHFNRSNESKSQYNLLFLEDLMDRMVSRLSKLYNVTDVKYDYNRYTGRMYDPDTDVSDYTLTITIE